MSAFGNSEQDRVMEAVRDYITERKRDFSGDNLSEIMEDLLDAVNWGIKEGLEHIERESNK